jgi:hypothetical protein
MLGTITAAPNTNASTVAQSRWMWSFSSMDKEISRIE